MSPRETQSGMNPDVVDWEERVAENATASDALLLDDSWRIVYRMKIQGGICEDNPESVQDARLLLAAGAEYGEDELFLTYMTYRGTRRTSEDPMKAFGSEKCAGHWMSRLQIHFRSNEKGPHMVAMVAQGAQRLVAERNGGIVVSHATGQAEAELINLVPALSWRRVSDGEVQETPAPESFADSVHNSIHPVWVDSIKRYVGVAHRHYFDDQRKLMQRDGNVQYAFRKLKMSEVPFQYGFSYRVIFFTLTEELHLDRYSKELLFPGASTRLVSLPPIRNTVTPLPRRSSRDARVLAAIDTAHAPRSETGSLRRFAEGIQFVTSAMASPNSITFFYGINDCETAKLSMPLDRLETLLQFTHRPSSPDAGKQEVQRDQRRQRALMARPQSEKSAEALVLGEFAHSFGRSDPGVPMQGRGHESRHRLLLGQGQRQMEGIRSRQLSLIDDGFGDQEPEPEQEPEQEPDQLQRQEPSQWLRRQLGRMPLGGSSRGCPPLQTVLPPLPSPIPLSTSAWRTPALIVHMHKSGGTIMCHLAYENGERLRDDWVRNNCNDPIEDISRVVLGDSTSCKTRVERSLIQSYQSLERWMDSEFCPESLQYVTLLRDPQERMVANYNFARRKMAYARNVSTDDVMRSTEPGVRGFPNGQQLIDASPAAVRRRLPSPAGLIHGHASHALPEHCMLGTVR